MYNYIIVAVVFIVLVVIMYFSMQKRENFTNEQQEFANELALEFQNENIPTFTKYLLVLSDLGNTNDNLISKGVYNKIAKMGTSVNQNDILQEM
jgi:heme/copper-type cytochrome/quinol oxidase subunit 2